MSRLRNFIDAESVGATGIFGALRVYAGKPSGPTSCDLEVVSDDVRWNFDLTFRRQCGCDDGDGDDGVDVGTEGHSGREKEQNGGLGDGDGEALGCGEGEFKERFRVCFVRTSARLLCMTS